jgi:hypothetical protein
MDSRLICTCEPHLPPIVWDVDIDVMGVANEMMMSMGAPTSPLLEAIELVVITMLADYFIPSTTMGASSQIILIEACIDTSSSS